MERLVSINQVADSKRNLKKRIELVETRFLRANFETRAGREGEGGAQPTNPRRKNCATPGLLTQFDHEGFSFQMLLELRKGQVHGKHKASRNQIRWLGNDGVMLWELETRIVRQRGETRPTTLAFDYECFPSCYCGKKTD